MSASRSGSFSLILTAAVVVLGVYHREAVVNLGLAYALTHPLGNIDELRGLFAIQLKAK